MPIKKWPKRPPFNPDALIYLEDLDPRDPTQMRRIHKPLGRPRLNTEPMVITPINMPVALKAEFKALTGPGHSLSRVVCDALREGLKARQAFAKANPTVRAF